MSPLATSKLYRSEAGKQGGRGNKKLSDNVSDSFHKPKRDSRAEVAREQKLLKKKRVPGIGDPLRSDRRN